MTIDNGLGQTMPPASSRRIAVSSHGRNVFLLIQSSIDPTLMLGKTMGPAEARIIAAMLMERAREAENATGDVDV